MTTPDHDDPLCINCGPTCPACEASWNAERDQAGERRRGRPPLDVPRVCSKCSAPVVPRRGRLRPTPLCGACYFAERRRAVGVPARESLPLVLPLKVLIPRAMLSRVTGDDLRKAALELAHLLTTGTATLAPRPPRVARSTPRRKGR